MITDKELQKENPELYKVARQGSTEAPFSGKYVNEKADGMYHCAICDAPLFSSETKFDSRSGWPSFTQPAIKDSVILKEDDSHSMVRTEVLCAECGAHLGHVFPDGPRKHGKVCERYCVNSISLKLRSAE